MTTRKIATCRTFVLVAGGLVLLLLLNIAASLFLGYALGGWVWRF